MTTKQASNLNKPTCTAITTRDGGDVVATSRACTVLSSLRQKVFLEENNREKVQNSRKSKKNRCREESIVPPPLFHIAEAFRYLSSYIIDAQVIKVIRYCI
jgi:hypothetical protein